MSEFWGPIKVFYSQNHAIGMALARQDKGMSKRMTGSATLSCQSPTSSSQTPEFIRVNGSFSGLLQGGKRSNWK